MSSSLAAGLEGHGDAPQPRIPADYPFARAKALLEEYLSVRRFYYGDYYPLTEYSLAEDAWMAYQLDLPELGEGLVVVLKRPLSSYTEAVFPLRALCADSTYEVTDMDSQAQHTTPGDPLMSSGLEVRLLGAPDSALVHYRRTGSTHLPARNGAKVPPRVGGREWVIP